jgi:cation-transporting ATPase 13A3/4/5
LGVLRTFEFISSLRRMSVIVKRLKSTSMEIYVKGAPEVMADICDKDSCEFDNPEVVIQLSKLSLQFPMIMMIYCRTTPGADIA